MDSTMYEHFSRGDIVRLKDGVRLAPYNDALAEIGEGEVLGMHNAGFRGLEYSVQVEGSPESAPEICHNISAADLELVVPAALRAWPHQVTYRDGQRIDPQVEKVAR